MADLKLWGRRREDKRVARKEESGKDNYAPVQAVGPSTADDTLDPTDMETPACGGPSVFALIGATGGVGTTSLCTQLAHELAVSLPQNKSRRPRDPRVCLIDLDFEAGACAHHLDLLPSLSLADLCGPADQIDSAFTSALVSTHSSGVSLLAAPNTPGAQGRVNPHTVMAMLDAACELYEHVVIDLPRHAQPWTAGVMAAVDQLNLVCELTIPSLQAGRERLAHLSAQGIAANIILSKFERRSFKNNLRLTDAETALGQEIFSAICLDPDTTREALNCGEPAGSIRPEARFVKDVRKLVEHLHAQAVTPCLPQALTAA
jgi:pilus assembly protein CpaE